MRKSKKQITRIFIKIYNNEEKAKEALKTLKKNGIGVNGGMSIQKYINLNIKRLKYFVIDDMGWINICNQENPKDYLEPYHHDKFTVVEEVSEIEQALKDAEL